MIAAVIQGRPLSRQRMRGFTLLELIITVAVAVILVGLALPSFRATIISSTVSQTTNDLVHDLNLARMEAVRRGTMVAVINRSGSSDWSSGWYVQVDGKYLEDGTFTAYPPAVTDKDVVLDDNQTGVNVAGNYKVTSAVVTVAGGGIAPVVNKIIFTAQGTTVPSLQSYNLNVCRPDSKPTQSKWITVVASGMVSTQTNTTSSPAPPC
jgi:type IV fimbrial biogenesis protein FimT